MTQLYPGDSQSLDIGTNGIEQMVSLEKIKSLASNAPSHKRRLVVDDNSDIGLTLRIGLEESDPTMQVHSLIIRYLDCWNSHLSFMIYCL